MLPKNKSIRRKLMTIILLTSVVVMALMRVSFFTCEYLTFRQATVRQLSALGKVIAANSTAALAFANQNDAEEILSALKAERYVTAAALYDKDGKLFSRYPANLPDHALPVAPQKDGFQFEHAHLAGFQPVAQGDKRLGTLYLEFDTGMAMHEWLRISASITVVVMAVALLVAYLLSRKLQQQISEPILALAGTAKDVYDRRDYSIRAKKFGDDELGLLTDAFNQMLADIEERERALRKENTERKQAEKQLNASLKEVGDLKFALDEHAIVAMTDPQGKITYVNDKFCAISKYSREELLGQDHRLINSGHHSKEFIRDLWTNITHGRVWHGEIKNKAKDGSYFWEDSTIVPFLNEDGKPRQYVAIRADITQRKEAELALWEAQALYHSLVEQLPAGVFRKDAAGRYVFVNAWFCQLAACQPEHYLGKTPEESMHTLAEQRSMTLDGEQAIRLAASADTHHEMIMRAGTRIELEEERTLKDGRKQYLHVVKAPVINAEGKIVGTQGTLIDITQRKLAEDEIRVLNADLERRVQERTHQLEVANHELESFSYSVSHDLRAPLRHVQGYVEMLTVAVKGQLSEKARRYLKVITDASVEMGQLIDDLLAFSRMSRVELHEICSNLDRLVQDTIKNLELAMQGRNIVWKIAPLPQVMGDPALLKQVFANLIGNAVKYSRTRDPAEIEIGCAGEEDGRIIFFVRDNGAGFDMKYVNKLFGVFQRLHRADEFEGTGIGLATVRRIIARHGGRTWAEGKVGEGATLYFTLKPATEIQPQP